MLVKPDQIIAYFDFDGTLSTRDTLLPFLIYTLGPIRFLRKVPRLIPVVLKYLFKKIDNQEAKQRSLKITLAGMNIAQLESSAKYFALTKLNKFIKPEVYSKIEWHIEHKHKIMLVSANLAIYLKYWAQLHRFDYLIATEIEVTRDGQISGNLATANCYGAEKIVRIEQFLQHNGLVFCYSYGYGNSAGDHALLDFVNEAYWVSGNNIYPWTELKS